MKKYFYSDGINKFGPFPLEELKQKNITKETLIWFQGLNEWLPASNIPELDEFFAPSSPPSIIKDPPSFNTAGNSPHNQQPPKTWLVESILATLFCCLPLGIAGIVNASKVESRFYAGNVNGAIKASDDAAKWTKISVGIGVGVGILYFFAMIASEM